LWFEIAHQKWPEDGWDYFLAQMRAPDQDKYYPSLFWGLSPIDPAQVKAPAAPCGVYPERGLVVLRAEEGPEFWEGPWPAVGLRLGTTYAHSVPDCFALTGFYAYNQPLYSNRQVSPGYAGTDPGWSSSIRSHCGVMVDNREPVTVGVVPCRSAFGPLVKFCSARGRDIYAGVDMTRTLFLTKEYLADIAALASERARSYHWMIHGLGYAVPDNPNEWAPSRNLIGAVYELAEESSFVAGDRPWAVTMVRKPFGAADPAERVGVRLSMLGAQGTVAHAALAPMTSDRRDRLAYGTREPGMPTMVAARNAARTAFAALHEPYRNVFRVERFERVQEATDAIAVRVTGEGINDRLMVRWGDAADEPVTLSDGAELFDFAGYAFVRVGTEKTEVVGDLRRMRLAGDRGGGAAAVFVNGKETKTRVEGGYVCLGEVPAVVATPKAQEGIAGAVSCRWFPQTLCLATGGKGQTELNVRNVSRAKSKIALRFVAPEGLKVTPVPATTAAVVRDLVGVEPDSPGSREAAHTRRMEGAVPPAPPVKIVTASISVSGDVEMELAPGAEQAIGVDVEGNPSAANRVGVVEVRGNAGALQAQNALLTVAQGVVAYKEQIWPRQFSCKVFSPRYTVRYEYWTSTAATFLLDPAGLRRFRGDGAYPTVYRLEKDAEGREKPAKVAIGGFQGFSPSLRRPKEGGPAFLEESGTHPHGYYSDIEYKFTEDWIWMRYKKAGILAFDWSDRQGRKRSKDAPEGKLPELLLVADEQKTIRNDELNRYVGPAWAVFDRPAGHEFGAATFYPEGATNRAGLVWQPADQPLGFTFCREEELPALVAKWRDRAGDDPTQPRRQGDVRALSPH
jgi:hypothetical protein